MHVLPGSRVPGREGSWPLGRECPGDTGGTGADSGNEWGWHGWPWQASFLHEPQGGVTGLLLGSPASSQHIVKCGHLRLFLCFMCTH